MEEESFLPENPKYKKAVNNTKQTAVKEYFMRLLSKIFNF